MPHRTRIQLRRAYYHIMLRGNYRQIIFQDDEDRQHFYNVMSTCVRQFDYKVHLFCLMSNHIHLVIETAEIPISKIMQSICVRYVMHYNKKHQKQGQLFQGRFKSVLIQDEKYLLELCFYIHMNPVKAKMVESVDEYYWSSHQAYLGKKSLSWLSTKNITQLLQIHVDVKSNHYRAFMLNRDEKYIEPQYYHIDEGGNLIFHLSMHEKNKTTALLNLKNYSFKQIINVVCHSLQVQKEALIGNSLSRDIVEARIIVAYFSHYHANYLLKDIASYYGMQADSLSRTMNRYLKRKNICQTLQNKFREIEGRLLIFDPDIHFV